MDSTYFQVRLIKEKEKHERYSVEVQNEKYITMYMKRIWTLHYEFADAKINSFT